MSGSKTGTGPKKKGTVRRKPAVIKKKKK